MRALLIIAILATGAAAFGCKPKSQAERYSTDELRKFEAEQQPRLEKREERLDEAKVERQDESQKEIAQLREHIQEERAENLDEHEEKIAELQKDIDENDPRPAKATRPAAPDAGTLR